MLCSTPFHSSMMNLAVFMIGVMPIGCSDGSINDAMRIFFLVYRSPSQTILTGEIQLKVWADSNRTQMKRSRVGQQYGKSSMSDTRVYVAHRHTKHAIASSNSAVSMFSTDLLAEPPTSEQETNVHPNDLETTPWVCETVSSILPAPVLSI